MTDALGTDWQRLHNTGYDALEVLALGPNPGDKALLELVEAENRVLITLDKDFSELIFLHRVSHAGLIRLPDVRMSQRIEMVEEIIEAYGPEPDEHAVITLQGRRIRVSYQPSVKGRPGVEWSVPVPVTGALCHGPTCGHSLVRGRYRGSPAPAVPGRSRGGCAHAAACAVVAAPVGRRMDAHARGRGPGGSIGAACSGGCSGIGRAAWRWCADGARAGSANPPT